MIFSVFRRSSGILFNRLDGPDLKVPKKANLVPAVLVFPRWGYGGV